MSGPTVRRPGSARKVASARAGGESVPAQLLQLRDSIDNIDAALVHLLAERFKCTRRVGEFKAREGMPPGDPAREAAQIGRLKALAKAAKLDPEFAEKFLNFIIAEVIRHHESIRGGA
jgi:chorismate mutase